MMKHFWKRGIAAVCAVAAVASAVPLSASALSAVEPEPVKVLAIGDDCLAEVDGTTSAVEYVADYLGGIAVNRAEVGLKAADLLHELNTDTGIQQDVEEADVILVSVGVNDLIEPVLYDTDLVDMSQCSTLDDVANALPNDETALMAANKEMAAALPGVVETINATITKVVQTVQKQNSAANVVVQTVSNPLGVDAWQINASQNRQAVISQLYTYLDVCLQGGKVNDFGVAKMEVATGVNQAIAALPNVAVADFYAPYVGADGEKSLGFYFTDIANLKMTFTPVGQVLLAAAAIHADGLLSCGDGSVIAAAYDSTGNRDELKTLRPAIDEMIESASQHELVSYALGDPDGNGQVDTTDAYLCLLEYALNGVGLKGKMNPLQRRAADANNDGKLDTFDAYLWLLYYAKVGAGYEVDFAQFLQENGRK